MEIYVVEAIDPSLPIMGGGEAYSRNLLEYLSKNKEGVALLGVSYSNSLFANDKIAFIPIAHRKSLTGYQYFLRLMAKTPFMRIPVSAIIHAQRPEYMFPFVLFHRKNPKIVTLHGRILESVRLKRRRIIKSIYKIVESQALKHSDIIIVVDESTREFYEHEYPLLTVKMRVIPIGIDLSKFRLMDRNSCRQKYGFKPDDKVVVYVGRLEKEKNLDFLLECFVILAVSVPEATLVLVGDGAERQRLEGLISGSVLKRVIFMGALEPDTIPEIFNCADVLALCSLFEGSPTVVKEALACGVPIVTTKVGDVSQVIKNDIAGRIVDRNKEEFARALADVLLEKDREKIRVECAKFAADFGFERIGAMTVELYNEVLSARESNQKLLGKAKINSHVKTHKINTSSG